MRMPKSPRSAPLRNSSRGKMPSSSQAAANGAISSLQKRVTVLRMRSCSSVKYGNSVASCCGTACTLIGILHGFYERLDFDQHLPGRDDVAHLHQHGFDDAPKGRLYSLLHFHGLEHDERFARAHVPAFLNKDAEHLAGHGRIGRLALHRSSGARVAWQAPDGALYVWRSDVVVAAVMFDLEVVTDAVDDRFTRVDGVFLATDLKLHRRTGVGIVAIADGDRRQDFALGMFGAFDVIADYGSYEFVAGGSRRR